MRRPFTFVEECDKGCFVVTSHQEEDRGYVRVRINGRRIPLHVHIYEQCLGAIPEGMVVRHICDNRACINPEHLILGTHADNSRDMVERGRSARGERNSMAKLSEREVVRILLDAGQTSQYALGEEFGVHSSVIADVQAGRTWQHVCPELRRFARGMRARSEHGMAKLTEQEAEAIRIADRSITNRALATQYGVSPSAISNIRTGKRWGEV